MRRFNSKEVEVALSEEMMGGVHPDAEEGRVAMVAKQEVPGLPLLLVVEEASEEPEQLVEVVAAYLSEEA